MSIVVKTKGQLIFPDPAIFGQDKPITAQVVQALINQSNHYYEAIYNEAVGGNTTQTAPGHTHEGNGMGIFIPKPIFSMSYGVPITNSGATNDYKTRNSTGFPVQWTTQNASTYIINGGDQYRYTTSPKANEWMILAEEVFYVSAGATAIKPFALIGNNNLDSTIRYELLSKTNTQLDYSDELISGDSNVGYTAIANANGSGNPWLNLNSGSRISAGDFYILRVGYFTSDTPSANDGIYLFNLCVAER